MSGIPEICWIINMRNDWAARRCKVRGRLNYYKSSAKKSLEINEKIVALKAEFTSINLEKEQFKKYTTRLRQLLKKENAYLESDKNAGYCYLIVRITQDQRRFICKNNIASLAASFEADRAIDELINSGDS